MKPEKKLLLQVQAPVRTIVPKLQVHNLEQKRRDAERARVMLLGVRLQLSGLK
jgi:hypothetical protein